MVNNSCSLIRTWLIKQWQVNRISIYSDKAYIVSFKHICIGNVWIIRVKMTEEIKSTKTSLVAREIAAFSYVFVMMRHMEILYVSDNIVNFSVLHVKLYGIGLIECSSKPTA